MFSRNAINPKTTTSHGAGTRTDGWADVESKHDGWEAVVP